MTKSAPSFRPTGSSVTWGPYNRDLLEGRGTNTRPVATENLFNIAGMKRDKKSGRKFGYTEIDDRIVVLGKALQSKVRLFDDRDQRGNSTIDPTTVDTILQEIRTQFNGIGNESKGVFFTPDLLHIQEQISRLRHGDVPAFSASKYGGGHQRNASDPIKNAYSISVDR